MNVCLSGQYYTITKKLRLHLTMIITRLTHRTYIINKKKYYYHFQIPVEIRASFKSTKQTGSFSLAPPTSAHVLTNLPLQRTPLCAQREREPALVKTSIKTLTLCIRRCIERSKLVSCLPARARAQTPQSAQ